jgi:hypothetical protein
LLGGGEFEPLLEIKSHPSRGTKVSGTIGIDTSGDLPKTGKKLDKIALQRLARYAPNDNFVIGQGTRREKGKKEKLSSRKMTFCFSAIMASQGSSTLMIGSGTWTGGLGPISP